MKKDTENKEIAKKKPVKKEVAKKEKPAKAPKKQKEPKELKTYPVAKLPKLFKKTYTQKI